MSDFCEVAESVALAVSTCPATDVIMVVINSGAGTSDTAGSGPSLVVSDSGAATSSAEGDGVAIFVSVAEASSEAVPSIVISALLRSAGNSVSSLFVSTEETVTELAAASSTVWGDTPVLAVSVAGAASSVTLSTVAALTAASSAAARSSLELGLVESVVSEAAASDWLSATRVLDALAADAAAALSTLVGTTVPGVLLLVSTADGASVSYVNLISSALLESAGVASDDAIFRNPAAKAWVMNTETTAASWYDTFDFESIAQVDGRTLAVGPDGLFELAGGRDDGATINARVVSGLSDFGAEQVKRLDNMYFGYTSEGQLAVTVEAYESNHPAHTYLLEQRDADVPRNSRLTPGKGLWGRYWRLTTTNVGGADFKVHDASVDIATSPRRI